MARGEKNKSVTAPETCQNMPHKSIMITSKQAVFGGGATGATNHFWLGFPVATTPTRDCATPSRPGGRWKGRVFFFYRGHAPPVHPRRILTPHLFACWAAGSRFLSPILTCSLVKGTNRELEDEGLHQEDLKREKQNQESRTAVVGEERRNNPSFHMKAQYL